ncbi:MAG: hypothetical protein GX410_01625, partial [Elusimicrobia bacterium]|nr:hypothetical protein [Elusimicrobiota bacterium]
MRELSPMMQLAWSAAAAEAAASGHEFIETEHVLIGMTAVSKALPLAADGLGFSAEQLHDAAREQDILRQVLAKTLVAPEAMRRELRKALGGTGGGPRDGRISRSAACKAVFASAAELSDYKPSVTALQFLKAALLNPGHALKQALEQLGNTAFQLSEALDAAETSAAPAASERLAPGEPKRHHFPSNPLWGKAGT